MKKRKVKNNIAFLAGGYVTDFLIRELPDNLLFHNIQHTINVVRGVREICKHTGVSDEDREILLLAAWFHDTGMSRVYKGHEAVSQEIAGKFLSKRHYPKEKIGKVLSCIGATKMPQQPQNLLEQIICDADMYHMSLPEYYHLHKLLQEELKLVFDRQYTDVEWAEENLTFLKQHRYHTEYGQLTLEAKKQLNIERCRQLSQPDPE